MEGSLYLRCPHCKACTRFGPANPERGATCASCGRKHHLGQLDRLGSTPMERYARAEAYARTEGIDLASAYSVLLGILSRDQAAATLTEADPSSPSSGAGSVPTGPPGKTISYDPGFREAVAKGRLTIQQAVERGDRVLYASKLAHKHGLSTYVGFLVADNLMPLAEALERKSATTAPEDAQAALAQVSARRRFGAAVALVLLVAAGATMWRVAVDAARVSPAAGAAAPGAGPARASGPAPTVRAAFEIRTNPKGQVTAVRAHDPEAVLDAYCKSASSGAPRSPVRVTAPQRGTKLGVFRRNGALFGIAIRKDPRTGTWVAGNDRDPIVPIDASPDSPSLRAAAAVE